MAAGDETIRLKFEVLGQQAIADARTQLAAVEQAARDLAAQQAAGALAEGEFEKGMRAAGVEAARLKTELAGLEKLSNAQAVAAQATATAMQAQAAATKQATDQFSAFAVALKQTAAPSGGTFDLGDRMASIEKQRHAEKLRAFQEEKTAAQATAAAEIESAAAVDRALRRTVVSGAEAAAGALGKVGAVTDQATRSNSKFMQGMMAANYAFQDFTGASGSFAQKLSAIQNNIPMLLAGFGLGGGLVIGLSAASVAMGVLVSNFDKFKELASGKHVFKLGVDLDALEKQLKTAKTTLDSYRETLGKAMSAADLKAYNTAMRERLTIEEAITDEKEKQAAREHLKGLKEPTELEAAKESAEALSADLAGQQQQIQEGYRKSLIAGGATRIPELEQQRSRAKAALEAALTRRTEGETVTERGESIDSLINRMSHAYNLARSQLAKETGRIDKLAEEVVAGAFDITGKAGTKPVGKLYGAQALAHPEFFPGDIAGAIEGATPEALQAERARETADELAAQRGARARERAARAAAPFAEGEGARPLEARAAADFARDRTPRQVAAGLFDEAREQLKGRVDPKILDRTAEALSQQIMERVLGQLQQIGGPRAAAAQRLGEEQVVKARKEAEEVKGVPEQQAIQTEAIRAAGYIDRTAALLARLEQTGGMVMDRFGREQQIAPEARQQFAINQVMTDLHRFLGVDATARRRFANEGMGPEETRRVATETVRLATQQLAEQMRQQSGRGETIEQEAAAVGEAIGGHLEQQRQQQQRQGGVPVPQAFPGVPGPQASAGPTGGLSGLGPVSFLATAAVGAFGAKPETPGEKAVRFHEWMEQQGRAARQRLPIPPQVGPADIPTAGPSEPPGVPGNGQGEPMTAADFSLTMGGAEQPAGPTMRISPARLARARARRAKKHALAEARWKRRRPRRGAVQRGTGGVGPVGGGLGGSISTRGEDAAAIVRKGSGGGTFAEGNGAGAAGSVGVMAQTVEDQAKLSESQKALQDQVNRLLIRQREVSRQVDGAYSETTRTAQSRTM